MKYLSAITAALVLTASTLSWAEEIPQSTDIPGLQTHSQLQTQLQAMSPEDRALYQQLNQGSQAGAGKHGKGHGNGDHQRKRDGFGKGDSNRQRTENRQGSNFGTGYGSGYESRQGGYGRR